MNIQDEAVKILRRRAAEEKSKKKKDKKSARESYRETLFSEARDQAASNRALLKKYPL